MNKKKIFNFLLIGIATILFLIIEYYIFKLDVIPKKYYLIFTVTEIVLLLITILFAFFKKKVFYIISIILSVLLIIINSFGVYYIKHLDKFIDKGFTGDIVNLSTFYLISSNTNGVSSIDEITLDKRINYYTHAVNVDKALEKLGDYLYDSVDSINTYLSENTDSSNYLLIDKLNYNIYSEINVEIANKYKIIYEFDVETVEKRNFEVKDSYNIFIIGKDFGGRDDLNMLITVNTKTHQVLLTSMPRDLYIEADGYGFKESLTDMFTMGEDTVIKSIENFYQTTVDYKVTVYTENLVDVVDKLGGIEFCASQNFRTTHSKIMDYDDRYGEKMYVRKGCKVYNGIEILTIARERLAFNSKGDHQRQENCRQIMINIFKKVASLSTLSNYVEILDSFNGLYVTNMNRNAMTMLVRSVLDNNEYEVLQQHVGGELYYLSLGIERWRGPAIIPNESEHNAAVEKIKEILNN